MRSIAFLNPAGNPRNRESDGFRRAFERKVAPRHPRASVEHLDVPAESLDAVVAALAPLKRTPPEVIVTIHTTIAQAVSREMPGTPLVLLTMADPVLLGITDDPIAPRTNVSGFTSHVPFELKHVEMLKDLVVDLRRVGVISEEFWAIGPLEQRLLNDSQAMFGIDAVLLRTETPAAIERIAAFGRSGGIDAWFVPDTPFNRIHAQAIVRQIVASGKPSIGSYAGHVEAGGLLAYHARRPDPWPRMAEIVDLVLSGVPVREIPFERPKHFRVVVNQDRARQLGLHIPRSILVRADEIVP